MGSFAWIEKSLSKNPITNVITWSEPISYRHYADDVVERFVERCVANGMDVFRVFDALNDPRNMKQALQAVKKQGGHAQGTLSYTTSPVHTMQPGSTPQNNYLKSVSTVWSSKTCQVF